MQLSGRGAKHQHIIMQVYTYTHRRIYIYMHICTDVYMYDY